MSNTPRMDYNGVAQEKLPSIPPTEPPNESSHTLLSFVLAEKGPVEPQFVNGTSAMRLYGRDTFLKNTIHNNHQSDYLNQVLQNDGVAVVKRITLAGAKKAMLRVSIDLLSNSLLPIYDFDENWNIRTVQNTTTGLMENSVLGSLTGTKAIVKANALPGKFGEATILTNGNKTSYPLFDIELSEFGEFGNEIFALLGAHQDYLALDTKQPRPTQPVTSFAIHDPDYGFLPSTNNDSSVPFTLFDDGELSSDNQNRFIKNILIKSFQTKQIGRVHLYQSNVKTVVNTLADQEQSLLNQVLSNQPTLTNPYLDENDLKRQFNILTGKNAFGKWMINGDYPGSGVSGGIDVGIEPMYFEGGSNGYPLDNNGMLDKLELLKLYDEAVGRELEKFANQDHEYQNIARYPYTVFYDSGYAMRTKLKVFNIPKYRPEVTLVMTAFSKADYEGTPVEPIVITCVDAVDSSGCIDFVGEWDIQINGQTVANDLDAQGIMDYLNGTGQYEVSLCDEQPEEPVDPVDPEEPVDPSPETINVTYDGLYQTMTVTGSAGLAVQTLDSDNNVLGSGIIGSDGSVTYPLNVEGLTDGSEVFTSGLNSNIVVSTLSLSTLMTFRIQSPEYDTYLEVDDFDFNAGTSIEVDWGDGSPLEAYVEGAELYHDYVQGADCVATFKFNQPVPMVWFWGDAVTEIVDFGSTPISNPKFSFERLTKVPDTLPTFITDMTEMFYYCLGFTGLGVSTWDTSHVTKMGSLFGQCDNFNQPLNTWNVSNVTEMWSMFDANALFNQPLDTWDVSKVTNMYNMFSGAKSFNQDISGWDTSSVTDMGSMFYGAEAFNQDISAWNTSNVTNMGYLFRAATAFNSPLDSWDVSNVTNMFAMFTFASSFNQPIGSWNVSKVTGMSNMFNGASVFNQDLTNWCVSLIPTMPSNFATNAPLFTSAQHPLWGICPSGFDTMQFTTMAGSLTYQGSPGDVIELSDGSRRSISNTNEASFSVPLGTHSVKLVSPRSSNVVKLSGAALSTVITFPTTDSINKITFAESNNLIQVPTTLPENLTDCSSMFEGCGGFNYDISGWDVSHVTNMHKMFSRAAAFNKPIGSWNISNVTDISFMLNWAEAFNQNVNDWDVSNKTSLESLFQLNRVFNQPLDKWNVSNVTNLQATFGSAFMFNQDISMWDVSNVTNFAGTFGGAHAFNQPLNSWDVSKGTSFNGTFSAAQAFNQPLDNWNVSNATDMWGMFNTAYVFNQPLNSWDVSSVTDMAYMFGTTNAFNQPLDNWDTANVTNMTSMFESAKAFTQDLSMWCVTFIATEPQRFGYLAPAFPYPVWGTCPAPVQPPSASAYFSLTPGGSPITSVAEGQLVYLNVVSSNPADNGQVFTLEYPELESNTDVNDFEEIPPPPPANDNVAAAITMTGNSGSLATTNVGATYEEIPVGGPGDNSSSIWYKWIPSISGTATIDLSGSDFDTLLGLYTSPIEPATNTSLEFVTGDDDSGEGSTSSLSTAVTAGSIYYIAVSGYGGNTGNVNVTWSIA